MLVKIIGVVVVSFLAVVFLFLLTLKGEKAGKWGLALILGGGLANLLERFVHGYVTDLPAVSCATGLFEKTYL